MSLSWWSPNFHCNKNQAFFQNALPLSIHSSLFPYGWCADSGADIIKLEKVQKVTTRCVPTTRQLSYPEHQYAFNFSNFRMGNFFEALFEVFQRSNGTVDLVPDFLCSLLVAGRLPMLMHDPDAGFGALDVVDRCWLSMRLLPTVRL